jgi:hypothetical protein
MYNLIVPIDFFYMEMTNSLFVSGVWTLPNVCLSAAGERKADPTLTISHFLIALKIMSSLWTVWENFRQFKKLVSIDNKFACHLFLLQKIVIKNKKIKMSILCFHSNKLKMLLTCIVEWKTFHTLSLEQTKNFHRHGNDTKDYGFTLLVSEDSRPFY